MSSLSGALAGTGQPVPAFKKFQNSETRKFYSGNVWTFSNLTIAAELDRDLRLEYIGEQLQTSKKQAKIKAATPMPDILELIVNEQIDLDPKQVSKVKFFIDDRFSSKYLHN